MSSHTLKFRKSRKLLEMLDADFPNEFFDWKITILFYICINQLQELAKRRGKTIGKSHYDINNNIDPKNPDRTLQIKADLFSYYIRIQKFSKIARYDPFDDEVSYNVSQEENYRIACENYIELNKYFKSNSIF